MTGRDWSRAPVYSARDLRAAELDAFARGRIAGYLDGFTDGKAGADVEAAAEAAAFAAVVSRTFRSAIPHAELAARRDGPDSTSARRAREVHAELLDAVAASATTPTVAPWRAAA